MDPIDREREIEKWLDGALDQYRKVEPRAGLENRLLTNLSCERNRIALQRRWWWAAGTVPVTAAIVIAAWVGGSSGGRSPARTVETTARPKQESACFSQAPPRRPQSDHRASVVPRRRLELSSRRHSFRDAAPKLDKFPSPEPLNEQEQMLARYVEAFPQRAALVARAQADLRKQDEREMAAPWPKKSSDQPE